MSRIGKQHVQIPDGVKVTMSGAVVSVVGPKGTLTREFKTDIIGINIAEKEITFALLTDNPFSRALWGTTASHIINMIKGVTEGFSRKLILEGVGFKSAVEGKNLNFALGFSHPVIVEIPAGLTVTAEKNNITFTGIDKELVGQFASKIRAMKKPEPYKGKGFHYDDEVVRRKQGKKTA